MLTFTHDAYTIGWICALRDELTAAMAMLDERHGELSQPKTDSNAYELGRIGAHNVVLAGLPSGWTGKESAAIVATSLQSTFPAVRYGLMVGVGGAAPSDTHDIRLGDIVVSQPGPDNGGVVQYDFGKTKEKGIFHPTGTLNMPPQGLLTALTKIQARHRISRREYLDHLNRLPAELDPSFARPELDQQYVAGYDHPDDASTCAQCSPAKLKVLDARDPPIPRVFFGTIACADQVMRHGLTRDRIAKQSGALCFEMEAAGLMNKFPCIVIRGICDYADTHKNKQWQPYAAVAAASFAKELLGAIASDDVATAVPISSRLAETTDPRDSVIPSSTVTSNTDRSSTGAETPPVLIGSALEAQEGFYAVLNKKVIQSPSVALGRLVLDTHAPWDEYCTSTPNPRDDQIGISLQFRLRDILDKFASSTESKELGARLATVLAMESPEQALESASEKTYILPNASVWLKNACQSPETRKWIEQSIQYIRPVYLVVGVHTASNFPKSTEEIITAIQYRQVTLGWLWRWQVDSARLARDHHIWKPIFLTRSGRGATASNDPEFVEMHLANAVDVEELSDKQILHFNGSTLVL